MENQSIHFEKNTRFEPHVLEDTVDPFKNHKSDLWRVGVVITFLLEVLDIMLFFSTLGENILFQISIFNLVSFLSIITLLAIPVIWFLCAGTQKILDLNVDKINFKKRKLRGYESISKYRESSYNGSKFSLKYVLYLLSKRVKVSPEKAITSVTGILSFDPKTGLSEHTINEKKWSLDDHPYLGKHAYDVLVDVKSTDDEEVIIENLYEAGKTLKMGGVLIRTTMYAGESIINNLENIERQLSDPNISEIRQKALYSVYNHYTGREGNCDPIYCIHFGLPFTASIEKALEFQRVIRDEFELALNERKIDTVMIKDVDIMKAIIGGIFTGNMLFSRDVNEN